MERLFSYGTLQDETVQRTIFGRTLEASRDAILGHRLTTIQNSNPDAVAISGLAVHTALEPDANGTPIEGSLFHISAEELAQADKYESAEYKRIKVSLRSGTDAWVYVRA